MMKIAINVDDARAPVAVRLIYREIILVAIDLTTVGFQFQRTMKFD